MGTGRKGFYLYKDSTLGRKTQVPCWRPQRGYSKIRFNGRHFSLKHREKARLPLLVPSLGGGKGRVSGGGNQSTAQKGDFSMGFTGDSTALGSCTREEFRVVVLPSVWDLDPRWEGLHWAWLPRILPHSSWQRSPQGTYRDVQPCLRVTYRLIPWKKIKTP